MTCMNLGIKNVNINLKNSTLSQILYPKQCQGVQSTQSTEHTVCTELSRTVYNRVHNV